MLPGLTHGGCGEVPKTYKRVETVPGGGGQNAPQAKHRMNWANAIKGKDTPTCPFEYAGRVDRDDAARGGCDESRTEPEGSL